MMPVKAEFRASQVDECQIDARQPLGNATLNKASRWLLLFAWLLIVHAVDQ